MLFRTLGMPSLTFQDHARTTGELQEQGLAQILAKRQQMVRARVSARKPVRYGNQQGDRLEDRKSISCKNAGYEKYTDRRCQDLTHLVLHSIWDAQRYPQPSVLERLGSAADPVSSLVVSSRHLRYPRVSQMTLWTCSWLAALSS